MAKSSDVDSPRSLRDEVQLPLRDSVIETVLSHVPPPDGRDNPLMCVYCHKKVPRDTLPTELGILHAECHESVQEQLRKLKK